MQWFRDPLFLFLVLGGGLFVAHATLGPASEPAVERIVISPAVLDSLDRQFEATWRRPPNETERQTLIDGHIAEEVLYREALAIGLDTDDVIVRRRMRQKMEFLLEGQLDEAAPKDADLRAFFDARRDRYRDDPRMTFRHIYLASAGEPETPSAWREMAARLNAGVPLATEVRGGGMLPDVMEDAPANDVDRVFGAGFSKLLGEVPEGRWTGPVASAYGWHLVAVEAFEPPPEVSFDDVRAAVERDYLYQRQDEARTALVDRLKQGYDIVIREEGDGR